MESSGFMSEQMITITDGQGNYWTAPYGTAFDPSEFSLVEEKAPPKITETASSMDLPQVLRSILGNPDFANFGSNLAKDPILNTLKDIAGPTIGGIVGARVGGVPGAMAGVTAGRMGQNYLEGKPTTYVGPALEGLSVPAVGALGSGAKLAAQGVLRGTPVGESLGLPSLVNKILSGSPTNLQALDDLLFTLRTKTQGAYGRGVMSKADQVLADAATDLASSPSGPSQVLPLHTTQIWDRLGSAVGDNPQSKDVSRAYRMLMDTLRTESAGGNATAEGLLQQIAEEKAKRALSVAEVLQGSGPWLGSAAGGGGLRLPIRIVTSPLWQMAHLAQQGAQYFNPYAGVVAPELLQNALFSELQSLPGYGGGQ